MGIRAGDVLMNSVTGERIAFGTFGTGEGGVLEMEHLWPVGHRTGRHVHPGMEERWEAVAGAAGFRIGSEEIVLGPGESVVAAAGVAHESWNAGDGPAEVRIRMTPGLGWAAFVERLFALAEVGSKPGVPDGGALLALVREFPREIALP